MFFMMGITEGRKDLEYTRWITCLSCGRSSAVEVFMTYTVLSLFFIPVFKWDRHYYVKTICCGTLYELDPEIGKRIERGEQTDIQPGDMRQIYTESSYSGYKRCSQCGYETAEDFDYCPKCGTRFI